MVQIQGIGSCGGDSGGPLVEKMEEGYSQQVAITKGGDGQTACGSFPGIYTRLDDPEVFWWMKKVIFGITPDPCLNDPCGANAECEPNGTNAVCRCPFGHEGDPYVRCELNLCLVFSCGTNTECEPIGAHVVCRCLPGSKGDPFVGCEYEYDYEYYDDFKNSNNSTKPDEDY